MQKEENSIPIRHILETDESIYKFTNASIIRSLQIELIGSEDLKKYNGKTVTLAMNEIVDKKVTYRSKEE